MHADQFTQQSLKFASVKRKKMRGQYTLKSLDTKHTSDQTFEHHLQVLIKDYL